MARARHGAGYRTAGPELSNLKQWWNRRLPRVRYAVVNREATLRNLSDDLKLWWNDTHRMLSIRLCLGGFPVETLESVRPFLPYALALCLAAALSTPLYWIAPAVPMVASSALAFCSVAWVLRHRHPMVTAFPLAIAVSTAINWKTRDPTISVWDQNWLQLEVLLFSGFLFLLLAILWRRDIGRIFLFILKPGEPLPILSSSAIPSRNDMFLALRLLSPTSVHHYRNAEMKALQWIRHEGQEASNCHFEPSHPRDSGKHMHGLLKENFWGVCRYVLRCYMEDPGEPGTRKQGHVDHHGTAESGSESWWKGARAAYFTSILHMTQLKAFAVLLAVTLLSAASYAAHHRHGSLEHIEECTTAASPRTCQEGFIRDGYELAAALKESKANTQIPVALGALGLCWAFLSWSYRGVQLKRILQWEDHCRTNLSTEGLQLFHFLPDAPAHSKWYEVQDDKDISAPVMEFGLRAEHVFHVIDGIMLVVLLELLHLLHF